MLKIITRKLLIFLMTTIVATSQLAANGSFDLIEPNELPGQMPELEPILPEELDIDLYGSNMHSGPGTVVHFIGVRT